MHLRAILPRVASLAYYSAWPKVRPNGYLGRVTAALRRRAGTEWETPEQVRQRQLDKLNVLLDHAATRVPYYRRLARQGEMPIRVKSLEDLAQMPELTKEIIRDQGENLLAEDYPRDQIRKLATGGSTGEPLSFYSDEDALLYKNVAEAWSSTMAGLRRGSSLALFWGAGRFEPSSGQDLRESLQRLITNRMFVDCFQMSEPDLQRAHHRLSRFRPEGLLGYTSALVELARFLQRSGLRPDYPRKAVISAAETLDEVSREVLQNTFHAPVFNRYGSREMGLIAVECEQHRGLHVDCENVLVELADGLDGTSLHRILVTKLTQFSMPFIRYDIGDLAEGPISRCVCGRGFPVLRRVAGRVTETIRIPGGASVPGELFPHLFKDCGVREYQVIQAGDYSVEVLLVKAPGRTAEHEELMHRVIAERLGRQVSVSYRYVDRIQRSATGKLLPVISRVRDAVAGHSRERQLSETHDR